MLAQWLSDPAPQLPAGVAPGDVVPTLRKTIVSRADYTVRKQAVILAGKFGRRAALADPYIVRVLKEIRDGDGEAELKPAARVALILIGPVRPPIGAQKPTD